MIVRNPEGWFINTAPFSEEAKFFLKNGYYTAAPWGSPDWVAYWSEQLKRTQEGYSVGGVRITGDHYFYLNFTQMRVTKSIDGRRRKIDTFPDFWDMDYNFFHLVEIARHGTTEEEVLKLQLAYKPLLLDGGHHIICGKKRRAGYSLKNAAILANRYNNSRGFKSLVAAYDKKYSIDGTMSMVRKNLNFLNKHTGWAKKRDEFNRRDHVKASYKEEIAGVSGYGGYGTEVEAFTFKDNPDAARGKDYDYVIMEEIGKWPGAKQAYSAIKPCVEDGGGDWVTGEIIAFGTGGSNEAGARDFSEMFYDPVTFNFLPFHNIWDEDIDPSSKCGFFVSTLVSRPGYIDKAGNSLIEEARKAELEKRAKYLAGKSGASVLRNHVQEYPMMPSESFMSGVGNDFPIKELTQQLGKVRAGGLDSKFGVPCHLVREAEGVKLKPDLKKELLPLNRYPMTKEDMGVMGLQGAVVVYEFPVPGSPRGLYKIGYDPYRQDQSEEPSMGAIYVYKSANEFSYTADMIVAEYVGRPEEMDDCHRIAEYLAEAYNTEVMHENEIKDVKSYFSRVRKLHLLARQPDDVISAAVKKSGVNRIYGCHMTPAIKDSVEKYIKQWLLQERDTNEDGEKLLNLHTIYSPALLEELIKYDRKKGNFDRIMALGMCLIQLRQETFDKVHAKKEQKIAALVELKEMIQTKNQQWTQF